MSEDFNDDSEDREEEEVEDQPASEREEIIRPSALVDPVYEWLQNFEQDDQPVYMNKLAQLEESNAILTIEAKDLPKEIQGYLTAQYDKMLDAMNHAAQRVINEQLKRRQLMPVKCRIRHAEQFRVKDIAAISERHIDRPVFIRGRVASVSPKLPYFESFTYHCRNCSKDLTHAIGEMGDLIKKPRKCSSCDSRRIEITSMVKTDYQRIKLIEVKPANIPTSLQLVVFDPDLCNRAIPGTVIESFGKLTVDFNAKDPIFTQHVNHLEGLFIDDEVFALTPEDVKRFARWLPDGTENPEWIGNEPQFMEKFRDSFCREVVGYEAIKHALVLQIASLTSKDNKTLLANNVMETLKELVDSNSINIYLVGSSATAKSTMMKYAQKIAPVGDYTSISNSTEAGLTVSAGRDQLTGYMMMEPGFLARCDAGLAAMDEWDKAKKWVYEALHEAGSHKTISSSKGGQVVKLPADCAWLGGGNTAFGQWRKAESLQDNLSYMPASLLTRFDLIYILHDTPNAARDEEIAMSILDKRDEEFWKKYLPDSEDYYGFITIKKYLNYIYLYVPFPKIPKDMKRKIAKKYSTKRQDPKMYDVINSRYVGACAKISLAEARFMQEKVITDTDMDNAMDILDKSLNESAFDPATGELDRNILDGVRSKGKINKELSEKQLVLHAFKKIRKQTGDDFATTEDIKGVLAEDFTIPPENVKSMLDGQANKIIYASHKEGKSGWRLLID